MQLYGSAEDQRGMGEIAQAYTVLGIEQILTGFDHLLFVFALLFLVGFNRRLVLALTAFTLAHSLTLALAALGWLVLRRPPVERRSRCRLCLSPARRCTSGRPCHAVGRRWWPFSSDGARPRFAGALKEIGLPQKHLWVALLTFNVGVELGQLLVVAVAYPIYRAFASRPKFAIARTPALYAIGSIAAYWSIGRIVSILT